MVKIWCKKCGYIIHMSETTIGLLKPRCPKCGAEFIKKNVGMDIDPEIRKSVEESKRKFKAVYDKLRES